MGGPLFKRTVAINEPPATHHFPRGVLPARFGQHSGSWWLRRALAASPNRVHDIHEADVVFVDDFCYVAWSEAKMHHKGRWGADEELYVDPDAYLSAAYKQLRVHPVFVATQGAKFAFFHSHPASMVANLACAPEFGRALHMVTEAQTRGHCGAATGQPTRPVVLPYASFPLYPDPEPPLSRPKTRLLYFRATCEGSTLGKALRKALVQALQSTPNSTLSCDSLGWEDTAHQEMVASRFCLVAAGDTASSRRLSEAVLAGCVPVFVGPPYPALPLLSTVHYDAFSLTVAVEDPAAWLTAALGPLDIISPPLPPTRRVGSLAEIPRLLAGIDDVAYEKLRYQLAVVRPQFSYVREHGSELAGLCDVAYSRMCHHAAKAVQP